MMVSMVFSYIVYSLAITPLRQVLQALESANSEAIF